MPDEDDVSPTQSWRSRALAAAKKDLGMTPEGRARIQREEAERLARAQIGENT